MKFNTLLVFIFFLFGKSIAQELVPLEDAISRALENNYDVRLSQYASKAATTDKRFANGAFAPQINATGATVWNNNDQQLEFQDETRNNSGTAKSNNLTGSVALTWTLFDGTKMFATRERIATIAAQGELLVKEQMVNTVASVIINYYDIVRQKQQLEAIREQMAVSEERVKLADRKLQVGTGGKPELLQARVDFNAQRTQALQQEAMIVQLKAQLNALTGLKLPETYDVSDTIIIDLNLKQEELISNTENTNYGLLAAKRNFDIAALTLHEQRSSRSPVINFNGAYNFSRIDNTQLINPFSSVYSQSDGFNYGFSVSVPILNGLNTQRQIRQAKINVDRQHVLYQQQKTTVDVGVRNAYVNYDNARKVLLIEEENILLAKENVFIALESFKRGVATFIELRTAQQSLADAYSRLIAARYNTKVAETELLRLNGGLLK